MSPYKMPYKVPCKAMVLAFSGLLLLPTGILWGQNPASGAAPISAEDHKFILDAAQSGFHEVKMGMLGVERGTNRDLKVYAQRILDDHALSNAAIQALARLKGVVLPDAAKTDDAVVRLSRLTGIEFDQAFVHEVIEGHLKDLAEFEKVAQSSTGDMDIQGYARSELTKLKAHLEQAQALKP